MSDPRPELVIPPGHPIWSRLRACIYCKAPFLPDYFFNISGCQDCGRLDTIRAELSRPALIEGD